MCKIKNKNYKHYFCDLSETKEIHKTLDLINNEVKSLDVLINNAGITGPTSTVWDYNINEWNKIVQINL